MSQNSLPQSTPKWLQDLKQGRTRGQGAALGESPNPAGMAEAEAGSGEEDPLLLDLRDRLSGALLSLHRRATSLTDDPVEAAKLIQESCLTFLAEGDGGDAGSRDNGPDPEAWLGDILEARWRERPSQVGATGRSFDDVQKMAPQAVMSPQSIDLRPILRQIATVLQHLPRVQRDILIGIAGAGAPDESTAGAAPERTTAAFHRPSKSGTMVEREQRMALPKVILLALLIPFLDPKDQAALEREDVTAVLSRCAAALQKELETPGPELLNAERTGALLVQLLIQEIIPEQITSAGRIDLPGATPGEDTDPTRGKPDQSAIQSDAVGSGPLGPATVRQAIVMLPEGLQQAFEDRSSDACLPPVTSFGASYSPAMRPKRLARAMGSRLRAGVRSNAQ